MEIFSSLLWMSLKVVCVWWVRKANSQSLNTSCGAVCLLVRAGERNKVVNSQHSGHFSSDRVSATEKDFQHKLQKRFTLWAFSLRSRVCDLATFLSQNTANDTLYFVCRGYKNEGGGGKNKLEMLDSDKFT